MKFKSHKSPCQEAFEGSRAADESQGQLRFFGLSACEEQLGRAIELGANAQQSRREESLAVDVSVVEELDEVTSEAMKQARGLSRSRYGTEIANNFI